MKKRSKKVRGLILCGLTAAFLIIGCGKTTNEPIQNREEDTKVAGDVIATGEIEVDLDTDKETDFEEEEGTKDSNVDAEHGMNEVEGEDGKNPDASKEETSESDEEQMTTKVVNNNGHFVQVGDEIYFHVADADSLGKSVLWAQFADQQAGRTILFKYDAKKGEAKEVASDFTSGGISVQGDVLYTLAYKDNLESPEDPEAVLGIYNPKEGTKTMDFATRAGEVIGAGLNDSFLAVHLYDYVDQKDINQILIYKGGVLQKTIEMDQYKSCVALGDNVMFYLSKDAETGYHLKQLDVTTGTSMDLGKLPTFDDSSWGERIDEVILDDMMIYFTYSSYEGTGNFFSKGYFVQAKAGVENSIDFSDMPERIEDGEPRAAKFAVDRGKMIACEGEPGTCEVKGDGTLGYYDNMGDWVEVAQGWESEFFDEDGNYKGVELAEKVGEYIFLIYNGNKRVPEDDIGWRYAYCRDYSNVYVISIETKEAYRLVHQAAPWSD